ncbi:30S ribosomal protein S9 [Candidatus Kaiserbacteria bacterium]|nr:30S ribosomal protein S9 [Candidatus Kaiserbacteria bacterium]
MVTTKYTEGIGRRKTATARVRIIPAKATTVTVNDKPISEYFTIESHVKDVMSVLDTKEAGIEDYTITAKVSGSGLSAQAEAIRLGIARALVGEKKDRRSILKPLGFLKRDPRSVERKKFGLLKARRKPQWSKR